MRIDRFTRMASRTYKLSDVQTPMVRNEIESIQVERRAAMGPDALEYDRLRDEMTKFWSDRSRANGDENPRQHWREVRRDPKLRELRDQMRKLDEKYPFDWEASIQRIERLLPEEQAKKGRERWEKRRQQWRQRRNERNRSRGPAGNRSPDEARGAPGGNLPAQKPLAKSGAAKPSPDHPSKIKENAPAARPAALGPWEKYVHDFIPRHGLTPAQKAAALAILKELQTRAAQFRQANADRIAKARRIADAKVRQERLGDLNKPLDQLFEELQKRLDGLLTAAQRDTAKPDKPSSHG
ncbi:MAG: hypothetical protein ACE5F9_09610 [Phycisphaerae bacterium]